MQVQFFGGKDISVKARQTITDGGFGPDEVVFLTETLEFVWAEVAREGYPRMGDPAADRIRIALLIMAAAQGGIKGSASEFRTDIKRKFLESVKPDV
ncbi:hypothetical protein DLM45_10930 [Hyphomicrobium methylovorum]|nr:hypothetical protein [Hyphomicrobium methylovorum]